jgi:hypothetical protein
MEKKCSKCEKILSIEDFGKDKRRLDGRKSHCRQCCRDYQKKYNANHREHYSAYKKVYYITHKGRIRITQRQHYTDKKEYIRARGKQYRINNAKAIAARKKLYHDSHREQRKQYIASHREQMNRYLQSEHGRSVRAASRVNRRARKRSVAGTHTPEQIQDQLKRQKHKCYYCQKRLQKVKGKHIYHIDHTFPLSRVAGTDIPANDISYLVLTCPACNLAKGNKFPWEFWEGGRLF